MSVNIHPDCLRPAFTEIIAKHLDSGKTINVFGEEGHGLNRLIEDLGRSCPQGVKFVRVNMRSYADSYPGFLEAVCTNLGIARSESLDFRTLLNRHLDSDQGHTWLCLEHFDRLSKQRVDEKNVDTKGYDIDFLNYLNSLNGNHKISLLLTSSKEIMAQELYIGGVRVHGSRLDIGHRLPLDELNFAEIENQLRRSMGNSAAVKQFFKNKPTIYAPLITEIAAHPAPLSFLEFIAHKIPLQTTSLKEFQELLKFWKSDFAKKFAPTRDRQIANMEGWTSKFLDRVTRVLGISKTLEKTNKRLILILLTLGGIVVAWMNYSKDLLGWFKTIFNH